MRNGKNGFTLIELVVAIGLMAVMFTALSVVFNQATGLIRRSEGEVALYQTFRLVYKAIRQDFETIVNYEEPVFYSRYGSGGAPDPKLDYCGYMRIEDIEFNDSTNKNIINNSGSCSRVCDNISFLASNQERIEIQNYLTSDSSGNTYVKNNVKGTDLVEISYGIENAGGSLIKAGGSGQVRNWTLMRYVREVVDPSFVKAGSSLYGLVYKNGLTDNLTGHGTYGMDIFNGTGTDSAVAVDYTTDPASRSQGRDKSPGKYGERAVLAEGCCGFDVKYWYPFSSDWTNSAPDSGSGTQDDPYDPYTAFGYFYNGMPPNPANAAAAGTPNEWYLPRMMQVRITLTDKFRMVEQNFFMRVHIPASNPLPKVQ